MHTSYVLFCVDLSVFPWERVNHTDVTVCLTFWTGGDPRNRSIVSVSFFPLHRFIPILDPHLVQQGIIPPVRNLSSFFFHLLFLLLLLILRHFSSKAEKLLYLAHRSLPLSFSVSLSTLLLSAGEHRHTRTYTSR